MKDKKIIGEYLLDIASLRYSFPENEGLEAIAAFAGTISSLFTHHANSSEYKDALKDLRTRSVNAKNLKTNRQ